MKHELTEDQEKALRSAAKVPKLFSGGRRPRTKTCQALESLGMLENVGPLAWRITKAGRTALQVTG